MKEIIEKCLGLHKECVECEGEFKYNEKVYIDALNQAHCEVCYKEKYDI
ncbi:hypothetical protein ACDN41_12075 [Priestia aryabhattai]